LFDAERSFANPHIGIDDLARACRGALSLHNWSVLQRRMQAGWIFFHGDQGEPGAQLFSQAVSAVSSAVSATQSRPGRR
jgi:hypothetical protein